MGKCIVCSTHDGYDHHLTSHFDKYQVRLDPDHGRIEVVSWRDDEVITDAIARYCPICGSELGVEVE